MKKGISLIVLVITVIVMIIIATTVIISINNVGIIRQANTAVDVEEEQRVQHLITLAWADAYIDGNRTPEDLRAAMQESLTGIDLSRYEYTVTERGAFIVSAISRNDAETKRKQNGYGFYYDYGYRLVFTDLTSVSEGGAVAIKEYVLYFHDGGSMEVFEAGNSDSYGELVCRANYASGSCKYSNGKITLPDGKIAEVSMGGKELVIDRITLLCDYTVGGQILRNFNYMGFDNSSMPIVLTMDEDNVVTVYTYTAGDEGNIEQEIFTEKATAVVEGSVYNLSKSPIAARTETGSSSSIMSDLPYELYVSNTGKAIVLIGEDGFPYLLELQTYTVDENTDSEVTEE